jgi:dTDP-D-glucose 4,6-dehydratase|tara:strand:- start:1697 stop:1846 length:150 start_codon:yes stop_codon:yes gene_type:complete
VSGEIARMELNLESKISFKEGLRRYIMWYKEREEKHSSEWGNLDELLKS